MAGDLNQCHFIGRLGQDPDVRYMPSGDAVTTISLAVSDKWKDKQTGEQKESVTWVRVVAFKRLAEIVGQYLGKGSQVYIGGSLRVRKWQDQQGNNRHSTEIVAQAMQMLDTRSGGSGGGGSRNQGGRAAPDNTPPERDYPPPEFDDDIPF